MKKTVALILLSTTLLAKSSQKEKFLGHKRNLDFLNRCLVDIESGNEIKEGDVHRWKEEGSIRKIDDHIRSFSEILSAKGYNPNGSCRIHWYGPPCDCYVHHSLIAELRSSYIDFKNFFIRYRERGEGPEGEDKLEVCE